MTATAIPWAPAQVATIEDFIIAATGHVGPLPVGWANGADPLHDGADLHPDDMPQPWPDPSDMEMAAINQRLAAWGVEITQKNEDMDDEKAVDLDAVSEPKPEPEPKTKTKPRPAPDPAPGPDARADDPRPAPVADDADDELPALDIRSEWATPPPPREWLVDGWLPAHRISMIAGRGAAGKSQLALQLAYGVTSDFDGIKRTWFSGGPEITAGQGAVAFVTWEDDGNEVLRRMIANPAIRNGAPEFNRSVNGRFHFIDLAGKGPLWAIGASYRAFGELTPVGASLRATCQSLGVSLVIIDALSSAFAANENDRASVRAFLSSWDRWARDTKCAVLLVAHPPKSAEGVDSHFSGSTDWRAGVRSLLVLTRPKGIADRATLTCDKLNSARTPNTIPLCAPRWWERVLVDPNVIEIDDAEATEIRQRVMDALTTHGELSKNKIRAAIQKSKSATFNVVDRMELAGEIIMQKNGSAHLYSLASASENTKGQDNV